MGCLFTAPVSPHAGPALGLPDPVDPLDLFPHERQNPHGECCHSGWGLEQGCAYFSQQPDSVSQACLGCLRAVAAALLLIQKAQELSLGQSIIV